MQQYEPRLTGLPLKRSIEVEITNITDFEVTVIDEQGYSSHVHMQNDGKWKCQRCDRYRCEHVKFVQTSGVQLLPKKSLPPSDVEILTY
jgi:hypothetical protein